jgi:hypothetical protein
MPAESVRLERKSTSTKYKKGTTLSHFMTFRTAPLSILFAKFSYDIFTWCDKNRFLFEINDESGF